MSVLFVYNCNPVATVPDQNRVRQGLMREDLFTVVHDQIMTDTAKYADVILPATTFLEQYDIAKGYGAYHLQLVQPVIAPVGESRPNHDVFQGAVGCASGLERDGDGTRRGRRADGPDRRGCPQRRRPPSSRSGLRRTCPAADVRSSSWTCCPRRPDSRRTFSGRSAVARRGSTLRARSGDRASIR